MATTAIRPSQPARRGTGAEARLLHGQVRLALFSSHSRPPVETITTPQGQVALAGTSGPPLTLLLLGGGVRGAPTPRPSVYTAPRPAPLTCLGRDTDPRANLRRPGRSQQVSGAASSFLWSARPPACPAGPHGIWPQGPSRALRYPGSLFSFSVPCTFLLPPGIRSPQACGPHALISVLHPGTPHEAWRGVGPSPPSTAPG